LDALVAGLPGQVAGEGPRDGHTDRAQELGVLVDRRRRPTALLAHVAELRVDLFFQLGEGLGARRALRGAMLKLGGAGEEYGSLGIVGDEHTIIRHRGTSSSCCRECEWPRGGQGYEV